MRPSFLGTSYEQGENFPFSNSVSLLTPSTFLFESQLLRNLLTHVSDLPIKYLFSLTVTYSITITVIPH